MLRFKDFYTEAQKDFEEFQSRIAALRNWISNHPTSKNYLNHLPPQEKDEELNKIANQLSATYRNIDFGNPSGTKIEDIHKVNVAINRMFPRFVKPFAKQEDILKIPLSPSIVTGSDEPIHLSTAALQNRKIPHNIEIEHKPAGISGKTELSSEKYTTPEQSPLDIAKTRKDLGIDSRIRKRRAKQTKDLIQQANMFAPPGDPALRDLDAQAEKIQSAEKVKKAEAPFDYLS